MALRLADDEDQQNGYDDNRPAWREPYLAGAESDALEEAYNNPSATDDDLPEGHPDKKGFYKPSELAGAEGAAAGNTQAVPAAEQSVADQANELYKPSKGKGGKGLLGNLSRRKKIGGGVAGGGITLAIILFSFLQGPLEFIHLSKLLQRFHFFTSEEAGNSRTVQLYKFAKNARAGTLENLRLGIVERRIAVRVDAKFEEIGLKKEFVGNTATYDGMTLNKQKFTENALSGEQFKGLSDEEFIQRYKEIKGIELERLGDGEFKIPPGDTWLKNRAQNLDLVRETGSEGIASRVASRIMGKRDGVTWHPIKRLDAKIVGSIDQKFSSWLAEQKARIRQGSESPQFLAEGERDPDPNDPKKTVPNATNESGAADVTAVEREAALAIDEAGSDAEGILTRLTHSTGGSLALGGAAIIGLVCAAQGISHAADDLKHDMVVLPLVRMAVEAVALGGEVQYPKDLDMTQLSFYAKRLHDPKTGKSWAEAKTMQAGNGQPQTGPDIPDEVNIKKIKEGSALTQFFDSIPGLSGLCSVANGPLGQVISFGISLLTPLVSIGTIALMQTPAAKDALAGVVKWLAGSPIPTVVFGPAFGNFLNYGAHFASNDHMAAMGGAALTPAQSGELRSYQQGVEREEYAAKPFYQKIFDPMSPDSVIAKAIDNSSTNVGNNVASIFGRLANPLTMFSSLITQKVSAATPGGGDYDYGTPEIGFSAGDLNSAKYQDPYANGEAVVNYLHGLKKKDFEAVSQKVEDCFGMDLSKDGIVTTGFAPVDVTKKDYASKDCANPSTSWTRLRFYIFDTKTSESLDCYDNGNADSCQQVGFSDDTAPTAAAPAGAFKGVDTSSQTCTVGSDAGIGDTPDANIKIRLCNVGGIKVNVAIEKNVQAIITNGQADGLKFTGGGYRSNAQQVTLRIAHGCPGALIYDDNCKPHPPTAVPGRSLHEWGLAVDLDCSNHLITSHADSCWQWLSNNQAIHNLINLASEPWHWSINGH